MEGDEALTKLLDSQEFMSAATNSTRLIAKLRAAIEKEELYETHQILRTVYFRFVNSNDRVFVLLKLLHLGACYLLKRGEPTSAQDVAGLLLEAASKCLNHRQAHLPLEASQNLAQPSLTYHTSRNTLDLDICRKVAHLALLLPDTDIGQQKFIASALDTLTSHGKLMNASLLHNVMAETFWHHKQYANSRYNYLHCASVENSKDVAAMLIEYQTQSATKSEVDLFITQFVFQFLCLQNPRDSHEPKKNATATTTKKSTTTPSHNDTPVNRQRTRSDVRQIIEKIFSAYTLKHPLLSQAATFKVLRDVYRVTWSRDPNYQRYLDRIGTLYFGVADPNVQQRQVGFLNNILASLFEGTDEDEEETEDQQHSSATVSKNLSSSDELD